MLDASLCLKLDLQYDFLRRLRDRISEDMDGLRTYADGHETKDEALDRLARVVKSYGEFVMPIADFQKEELVESTRKFGAFVDALKRRP